MFVDRKLTGKEVVVCARVVRGLMWLLINEVKRHTWTLTLKTKSFILTQ